MFSLDGGGRVQAADLVIWTAMDRPEQAGKSWKFARHSPRLGPQAEIVDFQVWLDRVWRRADTWDMWGAAYLLCDSLCSGDGFWYFQVWLIGLGRDAFQRAVANPDNLASLPEVLRLAGRPVDDWSHDDWPDWESLSYVAWEAYE